MTDQEPSLREIWQLMHVMNASLTELKQAYEEMKLSQEEMKLSQEEMMLSLDGHKVATAASFRAVESRFDGVQASFDGVQASIRDVWKLQGATNQRVEAAHLRIDEVHQELAALKTHVGDQIFELQGRVVTGFGALRTMIEARDFRLDDQARRISRLENPNT
ncbi:MAG TPA: hypothetical protein VHB79_16740 [Polyangiaceae bacterium]|nr:hypothetical protein [Polyangiaceae bacterium]